MRPIVEIYFYPRPPRGGRHNSLNGWATDIKFLSTPSARRATKRVTQKGGDRRFLSTPSVRRAIDFSKHKRKGSSIFLSTPSARRATGRIDYETHRRNIFLSTPSARRATQQPERMGDRHQISIHALREEGDQKGHTERRRQAISIHALREEGDVCAIYDISELISFLSTPSARRATACWVAHLSPLWYFYPRPPRGGRL